MKNGKITDIKG